MRRFYFETKGNYLLCFDTESLKWFLVKQKEDLDVNNPAFLEEIERIFNTPVTNATNQLVQEKENDFVKIEGLSILTTLKCNLQCIHCFYNSSPNKDLPELPSETIPTIVSFIKKRNITSVTIGGGEPLVWQGIEQLLLSLLYETNAKIFLLTNGLLIKKILPILTINNNRFSIQISIDASSGNIYRKVRGGNFDILIENIKLLKDMNLDISLSYTVHKYNQSESISFIKLAERLGVDAIHFPFLEQFGRASQYDITPSLEYIKKFYQFLIYYYFHMTGPKIYFVEEIKHRLINRLRRKNCSAAYTQIAIGADGNIYPCSELISDKFIIGTIDELEDVETLLTDFRKNMKIGLPIVDKICSDCPIKYLCGGGCRAVDLLLGKDYYTARQNPILCDILKKSVFTVLWELANQKLGEPVSVNELYDKEIFYMVKEYEKLH